MMPPSCRTLIELLEHRAETRPDQMALGFLPDGEVSGPQLSYESLVRRVGATACALRSFAEPGERALLLLPAGLEFVTVFFGCLSAGIIAVPAPAPHPARLIRLLPRLQAIAADAQASLVVAEASLKAAASGLMDACPALREARWITPDEWLGHDAALMGHARIGGQTTALLQYTSGSTAAPRGVIVTHENLLRNLAAIEARVSNDQDSVAVCWLPQFHDMGLIGGILQPLFGGYPGWLMSPLTFLQRPIRWLEALSRLKATFSGGPNFAYDLCVRRTTPEQRAKLDLRAWRYAFNGAEPVRAQTMTGFAEAFAVAGFQPEAWRPVYGLAEATLMVSGGARRCAASIHPAAPAGEARPGTGIVGCGPPVADTEILVVDPHGRTVCGAGEVGEIWVRGPGVAQGYWCNPQATSRVFGGRVAGSDDGPFLRTGDLGFCAGGEVCITGRLKDTIIIRGRKLYPQDIEFTAEQSHGAIRFNSCAAFTIPATEEDQVVIAVEVEPRIRRLKTGSAGSAEGWEEITASIRQSVSETHELALTDVLLLPPGALPRTTSGKLRRGACRDLWIKGDFPPLAMAPQRTVAM